MSETKNAAVRLQLLGTRMLRLARSANRGKGIGSARYSALAVLYDKGPLSVVELARAEHVAHPTMSRIVAGLQKIGAIERHAGSDRRQRQVVLTDAGKALYEEICANRTTAVAAVLMRLKPESVDELVAAVSDVVEAIERTGRED